MTTGRGALEWLWILSCLLLAVLAELILGSAAGLAMPCVALVTFYLTVTFGWQTAALPGIAATVVLDAVWSRPLPLSLPLLAAALAGGMFWRRQGDCRHGLPQALPGATLAALQTLLAAVLLIFPQESFSLRFLGRAFLLALQSVLGAAVCTPLLCYALDAAAGRLRLDEYRHAGDERGSLH